LGVAVAISIPRTWVAWTWITSPVISRSGAWVPATTTATIAFTITVAISISIAITVAISISIAITISITVAITVAITIAGRCGLNADKIPLLRIK
jgi:hypothetical protein